MVIFQSQAIKDAAEYKEQMDKKQRQGPNGERVMTPEEYKKNLWRL